MNAVDVFKEIIGERIKPLIINFSPYTDSFETHPFRHSFDADFESRFSDLLYDSIVFYAYEKDEIEKEYEKGRLYDLKKASIVAYDRVPKTERKTDGLMGELTLDCFVKLFFPNIELLYSRAKYMERIPHKEKEVKKSGHEIKGYDSLVFSVENDKKIFWAGQVKTGKWDYCLDGIKEDINKSIIKYYFADSMAIMCDIMRAVSSSSDALIKIIDGINDIIFDSSGDREKKTQRIIEYYISEGISIRIPCLIMPDEANYTDEEEILRIIKKQIHESFSEFSVMNPEGLNIEVLLLVLPLRNLDKARQLFLEARIS